MTEETIKPRFHVWFEGPKAGTYSVLHADNNRPVVLPLVNLPFRLAESLAEYLNRH
jgi:hypothetical protein